MRSLCGWPSPSGGPAPRVDAVPLRTPLLDELTTDVELVKRQRELDEEEDEETASRGGCV